jgi:Zn-dependent protease
VGSFDLQSLLRDAVLVLPVLILSLTFHEFAHAWTARKLGDDTAELAGRLTLNPLPHIDPFGTILLPLMNAPFGWAKPVPVNPARFRRGLSMSTGILITSAAGPLSNLLLASVVAVLWGLLGRLAPQLLADQQGIQPFMVQMLRMNVGLMIFNLLPIPPLDGGGVAQAFVPRQFQGAWDTFTRFAPFVLLALVLLPGGPLRWIVGGPIRFVLSMLVHVASAVAGV